DLHGNFHGELLEGRVQPRRLLVERRLPPLRIAGVEGALLAFRDRREVLRHRHHFLAAAAAVEIAVEEEGLGCGHQNTSSSSPRFLVMRISPLAARSLATATMCDCASSTSRRRTGPMACMSSSIIL